MYCVEFEGNNPELSGFQDTTFQEIQTEANTDPEQKSLCILIETGRPNEKATVPVLVHPYWSVRHELTMQEGLLFKQNCVVIPSSRPSILYKLHAPHRGTKFTLRHACSCVFSWRASTTKWQTCAQTAPLVHSMPSNILENH